MIEFRVEYKQVIDKEWVLDEVFESLGEAMDYIAREALIETDYDHRIVKSVHAELAVINALRDYV